MPQPLGPVLAAAFVIGISAQVPPPPPPPPPGMQPQLPQQQDVRPGNGVILGQVIDAGSRRPVPGAVVRLMGGTDRPIPVAPVAGGGPPAGPPTMLTNRDGRFLFRNLPPGSYNASVMITGYTPGTFGRRRIDGPGRPVMLGENERVLDATILVWKLAAITGTVTDEAGEPLIGISVASLRRVVSGGRSRLTTGVRATTDDRGMFRITGLTPGDYFVAVPTTVTSVPVSVAEEYIEMMRSASSGGSMALMQQRMESGAPTSSGSGMIAGDQQITIEPSGFGQGTVTLPPMVDGRFYAYPAAFHGGAASTTQATVIALQSGESRTGVDIRLRSVATSRVSGVMTGSEGPVPNLGVRLVPAEIEESGVANGFEMGLTITDSAGRFTFPAVPAGPYVLKAYRVPQNRPIVSTETMTIVGGVASTPGPVAPSPPQAVPTFWAQSALTVGGDDVTDVAVALRPGLRVTGRVDFQGTQPPPQPLPPVTVTLQPADGRILAPLQIPPGRLDGAGTFTTSGYPSGRYWLNVAAPMPNWTIKSITARGVNLIERPLELESSDITDIAVTFTDRVAELSGTVSGGSGPNDDVSVVVFPADYQTWFTTGQSPRRTVVAAADRKGAYQVRLPPPGDYIVAAVLNERVGELALADYAALARTGTRFSVTEGEKKTLALTARGIR